MLGQKEELPEAGYAKDGEEVLAAFNKMQCEWSEKGGEASVAITNKTDTKLAMKIKSSDNNLFRVRPVYTNIEPGKSVDLGIYRSAGPVKNDRIVVVLTKNTTDNPAEKVYEDKTIKTITTIIRQTGKEPKDEEHVAIQQKVEEKPQEGKPSGQLPHHITSELREPLNKLLTITEKEQKVEEKPPASKEDKTGGKLFLTSELEVSYRCARARTTDKTTRIDPVFTNIEPGKSADVAIIRSAAPAKEDKLVVVLAKNPTNVAPETVYKDKSIPTSTMILPQKPIAR
ncbi:unnamed protein product [Cylicocyclus nassatus]|uniref:Major sperm protein n=1 Tax=Cylicocyclus nassatus TaxID=53992 RepID=A0AA36DKC1_CYLNA|nr:unnamed protein product [Cylicocyclus nassatus]